MSDTSCSPSTATAPRPAVTAETYAEAERTLSRALAEDQARPDARARRGVHHLLGDPQKAYPVIHLTGTNGKTARHR